MTAPRVLVFESDAAYADELRTAFGSLGCPVSVVDDGQAGLDEAAQSRPDLIILAIELPRMNGFAVCNRLKKHPDLKDVPLLVISSEAPQETFDQHSRLRTHAQAYIHKPIGAQQLVERCREFVSLPAAVHPDDEDVSIEVSGEPEVALGGGVDELADAAFDHIMLDHGESTVAAEALAAGDSSGPSDASPSAVVPASQPGSSTAPGGAVAPGELDRLSRRVQELEAALATQQALSRERDELVSENARLRREAEEVPKLTRELDEARGRAAKGGGVSTREFLELREALNRKDKELLKSRDDATARERQVLEARERIGALEHEKGDLDDRLLSRERALAEFEEQLGAATAELERLRPEADSVRQQRDETIRARDELNARLAETLSTTAAQISELSAQNDALRGELQAARDEHARNTSQLESGHAEALEMLRAAHGEELARMTGEMEAANGDLVRQLESARVQHATELANVNAGHVAAAQALRSEHERTTAAATEEALRVRDEMTGQITELETDLSSTRRALAAVESQREQLEMRLADTSVQLDRVTQRSQRDAVLLDKIKRALAIAARLVDEAGRDELPPPDEAAG